MVRKGASRSVDQGYANDRLMIARAFLSAAETSFALAGIGEPMNPAISNIVLAAIAYSDALTAKFGAKINQQDHSAVVALVRAALGNRFPKAKETILRRILSVKDEFQYGAHFATRDQAEKLLDQLREFAAWAEDELSR